MSCKNCLDLCVKYKISTPSELQNLIRITKQNITDGTLIEKINTKNYDEISFYDLSERSILRDIISFEFICTSCGEAFLLHAETYHGSGGYWEPKLKKSILKFL